VGLTPVEPFAVVDVNAPGVIAMLVAPVVVQLSVLLEPDLMLAELAVKDVTEGAEPVPGVVVVGGGGVGSGLLVEPPQLVRPIHASRVRATAQSVRLA
jgi:hypothetical protein